MTRPALPRFDASGDARPLFKERFLWTVIMGLFFFLLYGSANQMGSLTAPHPSFYWDWEHSLPFVPELIIPYMSSDLVFVIAFLIAPTRSAIQKLALRSGLAILVSIAIFLAVPLEFSFERPETAGWPDFWFDLLSLDKPYNQFPSLHISLGFLAWHTITKRIPLFAGVLTTVWFVLILASTLLVFQHHAIDLPGGAAVAILVFWLIPETGKSRISLRFVTPRHLHMGFRYLIVSTVAIVAAFNLASTSLSIAIVFAWVGLSLLLVAASYVLGANDFLQKGKNGYSLFIWLCYWPYLLGCFLNWQFWRRKVSLLSEVKPGVWIGARPRPEDLASIEEQRIATIIDLVPELPTAACALENFSHIPLLDIAIPDPVILDEAARRVDAATDIGGVLVHCALGMSRSVLVVAAWLMRCGHTAEDALKIVDRARPERVRRPYIEISLQLYEDYLRNSSSMNW